MYSKTIIILVVIAFSMFAHAQDITKINQAKSLSSDEAISKAVDYLGLKSLKGVGIDKALSSVKSVVLRDTITPFLSESINKDTVWEVVFNIDFGLIDEEISKGIEYYKTVHSYIEKNTGDLLKVVAIKTGASGSELPILPPASIAEKELYAVGDGKYNGFPDEMPKTSFFDALKEVIVDYRNAVEITALYVNFSNFKIENKPIWDIHIYGFEPPLSAGGREVPLNQRNHLRHVIDDETGKCLFAVGSPHPLEKDSK